MELFTDPVQGRNPLHTYAVPGSYPVFVIIRNCLSVFGQASSPIFVTVPGAGPEAIFRDGFETGGMSRWSRSESGG